MNSKSKGKAHVQHIIKAHRDNGGIALLILNVWPTPRPGRLTPRKESIRIIQTVEWASRSVCTCTKYLYSQRFGP